MFSILRCSVASTGSKCSVWRLVRLLARWSTPTSKTPDHRSRVSRWIRNPRFGESLLPQQTTIAPTARASLRIWIITTVCHRIVDAEFKALADDLRLGHPDQRRVDRERCALRPQPRHLLERFDKFRPAIRVSAVVQRIDPDKHIVAVQHLGPRECVAEEDRVPRRDVGDGDLR